MKKFFRIIAATLPLVSALPLFAQINARICITRDELAALCGTANVRLVFVNHKALYMVDFSQADPRIEEVSVGQAGIVAPVISPDGKKIAYALTDGNNEYNIASSSAWVCDAMPLGSHRKIADTAFVPRFVYDGNARMKVVYATCGKATNRASYVWDGCGKVIERDVTDGQPATDSVIWAGGSYFGGLSRDGRYLSTAESGLGAFILDRQSPSGKPDTLHKFTVKKLSSGADTTVLIQVCNLSGSQSSVFPNAALYIDFSSNAFTLTGCALPPGLGEWGFHARLFVTRNDGKILRFFDVPQLGNPESMVGAGEIVGSEWNFPEWSNHPYFAVASIQVDRLWYSTSWDHTYQNAFLYMINLKDSSYHKLVETTDSSKASTLDMRWPFLWIETSASFTEDSSWFNRNAPIRFNRLQHDVRNRVVLKGKTVYCTGAIEALNVYSPNGKKMILPSIKNAASQAFSIDLNNLPLHSGCYFLQIVSNKDGKPRFDVVPFVKW
jgi:hypothetical protein